jgi:hypothetical protein
MLERLADGGVYNLPKQRTCPADVEARSDGTEQRGKKRRIINKSRGEQEGLDLDRKPVSSDFACPKYTRRGLRIS